MALDGLDLVPPGGLQRELHLGLAHAGPREGAVVVDVEHIGAGLPDEPGELAEGRANILHILHDRAFSRARVGETEVELTLETSGREQIEAIKRHLAQAGYAVEEESPR